MEKKTMHNLSAYETVGVEDDPFLYSSQLHPLDFSGFSSFNCQWEFPLQEESVLEHMPVMESLPPTDPFHSISMEIPSSIKGDFDGAWEDEFGSVVDDVGVDYEGDKQIVLYDNGDVKLKEEKKVTTYRERKTTSSSELSRSTISQYFYMPITQAAKELNVGLTLLKKRCRELGIPRWPHRKLRSLQTLINNVQEMEMERGEKTDSMIRAVELLEQQRKLMEQMPEVQLEEQTKKLRQACFKANYKKRKLMGILEWQSFPSTDSCMETYESFLSNKRVNSEVWEM